MPATATKISPVTIPAITDEEYHLLCGEMRKLGLSLRAWALSEGFAVRTTYNAARGERDGVESRRIQKRLQKTLYAKGD